MIERKNSDLTGLETGALFSDDMRYRYRLWRRWDDKAPKINFIMLNPSTADDVVNDPTVERCERRVRAMNGGELIVTNLFGLRATDPLELLAVADPSGPENGVEIVKAAKQADLVVIAWGVHGAIRSPEDVADQAADKQPIHGFKVREAGRGMLTIELLRSLGIKLFCLGKTQKGEPKHPLYVPYSKKPEPF
jgi:hypothetical protein